jgi:hypothetical protein
MTLTSMDGLTAAIIGAPTFWGKDALTAKGSGILHAPWYGSGILAAGAPPTGGLNGATFIGPAVAGQIPNPVAVAGATSVILRASATQTANVGGMWIVDRQWGNVPVVTTTTAQAIASPLWVPRDVSASTNGVGVFLALECSAACGNLAAITNTTVSYTNSAGTAGRVATLASWPITPPQGTWALFSLFSGDVGVRSVQSITLGTSYVSGQINLIAFRFIAELPTPLAATPSLLSFTQLGRPTVWDASVLQLLYMPTGTAVGSTYGSLSYAQG